MKKRYQVFVSSTYVDLREERARVMQSLLEMNCIPAGMELFPATDDDAWSLIKRVIDESDYYILILAGRYGSLDSQGMGFTEKEYQYAVEKKKPVLGFLHSNIQKLAFENSEPTEPGRRKLRAFYELVKKSKHVKHWENAAELAGCVTIGMVHLMSYADAVGWIRANELPSDDILTETIRLQKRVQELEKQLVEYDSGTRNSELAQGNDSISLIFHASKSDEGAKEQTENLTIQTTWDAILNIIARNLLSEPEEVVIRNAINRHFQNEPVAGVLRSWSDFQIARSSFEAIRIQFRVIGIVTHLRETETQAPTQLQTSFLHRSIKTDKFRWVLTEYGERYVTDLLAVRRSK